MVVAWFASGTEHAQFFHSYLAAFLFTLGLLGLLVHSTRQKHLVETGRQATPKGLMEVRQLGAL